MSLRTLLLFAAAVALAPPLDTAIAGPTSKWVEFDSAVLPVSPLRARIAKNLGKVAEPYFPPAPLKGVLSRPKETGQPGPAVVLMPSCLGIEAFHTDWAKRLTDWGYVTLIVDSFGPKGLKAHCSTEENRGYQGFQYVPGNLTFDAYGAHSYLSDLPYVDPERIAVLGWGISGALGTVLKDGAQKTLKARFNAVAALYPPCWEAPLISFVSPVLVMVGDKDDWTPSRFCQNMLSQREPVSIFELEVYKGAAHGFDNPENGAGRYHPGVWNMSKQLPLGATLAFNDAATKQAIIRIKEFFDLQFR